MTITAEETIPSLNEFWKMLRNHDWTYEYSDDGSVWRRGQKQYDEIQNAVKNGTSEHRDLFYQYSEYAWGRSKVQPSKPKRTRDEQYKDQSKIVDLANKLQELVEEVYRLDSDQIISAEQLWRIVNPTSSILYKMHELAEEKLENTIKDTVVSKSYKKIKEQLAIYCER